MIKNQRAYQYAFSKTHSKVVSYLVGVSAKAVGICMYKAMSFASKEVVDTSSIKEIRDKLNKIYPKPNASSMASMLLPADKNVDVSVIVPAYNAERYIEKCVESILNQKTKYIIELIVVNDKSTDKTAEILEKYRNIQRVKIIDLQDGGSAAKARNAGIANGVGRYVTFVDSDDVLSQNAVETLVFAAEATSADIVQGGWRYIDTEGTSGLTQTYAKAEYWGKKVNDRFDLPGMPWGKLYKREMFENIRFPDEYTCFEDAIIHFLVFRKAKKVVSIEDTVYSWRKNPNGITQTSQSRDKALQSCWIVEALLEADKSLRFQRDEMFAICLIGQLSNFCYVNVREMGEDVKKMIFAFCCDLYDKNLKDFDTIRLPYAVKAGADALKSKRFDLWKAQGGLYSLMR